jgi:hypothetical protein
LKIVHVNRLLIEDSASDGRSAIDDVSISSNWPYRDRSKVGRESSHIAVNTPNYGIIGFTNPRGAFYDGIKHRFDIRRRAGDHAQDLTRSRLLLQGLANLLRLRSDCLLPRGDSLF